MKISPILKKMTRKKAMLGFVISIVLMAADLQVYYIDSMILDILFVVFGLAAIFFIVEFFALKKIGMGN